MDEMKLNLTSKFMRGIVSKVVAKAIKKKLGYEVKVQINDLDVSMLDGDTNISLNVEVGCKSNEFMKIMNKLGEDGEA